MFFGNNYQSEKQKGKRTTGFQGLTFFIQPENRESSAWAGMSPSKRMSSKCVVNKRNNQWLVKLLSKE